MVETSFPIGEKKFNRWLVEQYLICGSVEDVFRKHRYGLPISHASYHRLLDKWGIIKTAGPNSKLNESLEFLYHLAETNIPLERLYTKMPPSFRTSAATLYRVLSYIKEGITRRVGTGLIITPYNNDKKVLVGEDKSTPRVELGKSYGAISIPVGFSKKRDPREDAILRILQQEVFTQNSINKKMPKIIPPRPKPFMFLDIADVRVEVFHIKLSKKYSNTKNFTSYKLRNYKFMPINTILRGNARNKKYRAGVIAGIEGYKKYLELKRRKLATNPLYYKSRLNYQLSINPRNPL